MNFKLVYYFTNDESGLNTAYDIIDLVCDVANIKNKDRDEYYNLVENKEKQRLELYFNYSKEVNWDDIIRSFLH